MLPTRLRYLALIAAVTLLPLACRKPVEAPAPAPAAQETPAAKTVQSRVTRAAFGTLADGTQIDSITLTNANGASVSAMTYGGIITSIKMPDRDGKFADLVLGYDTLDAYVKDGSYFGAIVGRYANRIGNAQFKLDGQTYKLTANFPPNILHGGTNAFNKAVWHAETAEHPGDASVVLTYTSPDGDNGFPGNVSVSVTYTLNDENALVIDYQATTDKPTVVNFTNHSYFNLGGEGSGDVLGYLLTINADRYTPVDKNMVPTGELASVAGTAVDFRKGKPISADIAADELHPMRGYDHNFVVNRINAADATLVNAARVEDPESGRVMEVLTTEPGVQLYTTNHQDGTTVGKSGHRYNQYGAVCLEAEHFPDSPNKPSFPSTTLRPGETYKARTVYKFSVEK